MALTSPLAEPPAAGSAAASGLRVAVHPGVPLVVEVCGEVDIESAPWLRDELLRMMRRHGSRIALDLDGVTFLDCAGINVLLATRRRALLEGGYVRVIRPSARVWRIISLLNLQDVLPAGLPIYVPHGLAPWPDRRRRVAARRCVSQPVVAAVRIRAVRFEE